MMRFSRHDRFCQTLRSSLAVILSLAAVASGQAADDLPATRILDTGTPISFQREVMAVISKAGCNLGTCHGNKNGKGGFLLSLRGQDPATDYETLVRGNLGRRIDFVDPAGSLILRKATAAIPHGGGRRFSKESPEYAILHTWVREGASRSGISEAKLDRLTASPSEQVLVEPNWDVQIHVQAEFTDGTTRDVTRFATFDTSSPLVELDVVGNVRAHGAGEVTVLARYLDQQVPIRLAFVPARPDFVWNDPPIHNFIDEHVFAKLRSLRMSPSELCSDAIFLRRVYLDLLGIPPTADEAREFLGNDDPGKRMALVDRLLDRPEFADRWALVWSDLLRNEERTNDRKGVAHFHEWLKRAIEENRPVDEFVREILTGMGSTYLHPEANFYRANRDPITRGEAVAQLFMGARLQCAKCHNHPFDRWTQDDYYSWAAVFSGIRYKVLENDRKDENDSHEFDGEQIVWWSANESIENDRTGRPAEPKLLGGAAASGDPLRTMAEWLTNSEHPTFSRAQANRVWYHLLGRGIVDPIDDFRATNPASNPALLDALAHEFVAHDFDLKHLVRTIVASRTYQLSSEPTPTNRDDALNFSHAIIRRLSAEELADALDLALGSVSDYGNYPEGTRAGQMSGVHGGPSRRGRLSAGDPFLKLFGKPPRLLTCECERSTETTLAQAFELISGTKVHELLTSPGNLLDELLLDNLPAPEMVAELYWSALGRPPTEPEIAAASAALSDPRSRREALEDVAWALVNSKEFLLRW